MIQIHQLTRKYGTVVAVDQLDLTVERGAFVVLLGESGCGKTTTLKCINRLIEPTSGTIEIDGISIADLDPVQLRRGIGYVIQGVGLFPHFSVAENVAVVPTLMGWDAARIRKRVDELLELVQLPADEYGDRSPSTLSGGQQQRVGVARALAGEPRIMLMDEPFGSLDPITRASLQSEYRRIHESLGLTTVMVTHDMTEALTLADKIVVMKGGRALRVGTPAEVVRDTGDPYVEALMETPRRHAAVFEGLA